MQSEHFPFLSVNGGGAQPLVNMHSRTTFYTALGRLLMVELGEDEERFERFMLPLRGAFLFVFLYLVGSLYLPPQMCTH